ncbi:DeoR family transcriptional regulator [Halarchaeum salinum]|uniref:HTH deoR-type domain-containing protein n=1 Tax=Halarchaeum salinum TaxID=489912 RepID=A0AAV3S6W9_9EURY
MGDGTRSGPFEKQHTDEALVRFIEAEEVVTTREVADRFDYHLQTARRRLNALHDGGVIERKDVGKRFVWWVSER